MINERGVLLADMSNLTSRSPWIIKVCQRYGSNSIYDLLSPLKKASVCFLATVWQTKILPLRIIFRKWNHIFLNDLNCKNDSNLIFYSNHHGNKRSSIPMHAMEIKIFFISLTWLMKTIAIRVICSHLFTNWRFRETFRKIQILCTANGYFTSQTFIRKV